MKKVLKQLIVGLLAPFGGIGTAAIGGLPGTPKGRSVRKKEGPSWINWGGSDLGIPGISQSQQAFEAGDPKQAYKSLNRVRREIRRGKVKIKAPAFKAQLNNNLAVSAHSRSQRVKDPDKRQKLQNEARRRITHAARIRTSSLEIKDTVAHNLKVIVRKR